MSNNSAVVAWFHPTNPNGVINAAQYPNVLAKNKEGYLPCIVAPEYVQILTWEVMDSLTREFRACRRVFASLEAAKQMAQQLESEGPSIRGVSMIGSKLHT